MLEGHALAVVDTAENGGVTPAFDPEMDLPGARVAGVLEQLAHEDPGVRPIARSLGPGPGDEAAAGCLMGRHATHHTPILLGSGGPPARPRR